MISATKAIKYSITYMLESITYLLELPE